MERRLYRSRSNRVFLGVCGGLGEYLNVDPVIVRVITIVLALITAFFPVLIAYLIIALIVPMEGSAAGNPQDIFQENVSDMRDTSSRLGENLRTAFDNENKNEPPAGNPPSNLHHSPSSNRGLYILGVALVAIGITFILINVFDVWKYLWPVLLIIAGLIVVFTVLSRRRKS